MGVRDFPSPPAPETAPDFRRCGFMVFPGVARGRWRVACNMVERFSRNVARSALEWPPYPRRFPNGIFHHEEHEGTRRGQTGARAEGAFVCFVSFVVPFGRGTPLRGGWGFLPFHGVFGGCRATPCNTFREVLHGAGGPHPSGETVNRVRFGISLRARTRKRACAEVWCFMGVGAKPPFDSMA